MPFTFLAHQAAVVPLKLRWPGFFSGTGLVLGSMAPDFGYFLAGAAVSRDWHRLHGIVLYCLPTALVVFVLLARVFAAPIARHLPRAGGLRELGWLEAQPLSARHLLVVAFGVIVGALTHLAWDLFTHGGSWMGTLVPWLAAPAFSVAGRDVIGSSVLWVASTALGGAYAALAIGRAARAGRIREWAERRRPGSTLGIDPYAPPATSPAWFWLPLGILPATAAAWAFATLPDGFHWQDKASFVIVFLRAASTGFVVLAVVALRERLAFARRSRHGDVRAHHDSMLRPPHHHPDT